MNYEEPKMEIILFESEQGYAIVTASGDGISEGGTLGGSYGMPFSLRESKDW